MRGRPGLTAVLAAVPVLVLVVAALGLLGTSVAGHRHDGAQQRSVATLSAATRSSVPHQRRPVVLGAEAFRRPGTAPVSVVASPAVATPWSVRGLLVRNGQLVPGSVVVATALAALVAGFMVRRTART